MARYGQFELLRPAEYFDILAEAPIAYVPLGALEWHGPHNPLGLDGLKAHGLLLLAAAELGGVVLPPFYLGHQTMKQGPGFRGTLEMNAATVFSAVYDVTSQLVDEGFQTVVLLMGHYGAEHVKIVQAAVQAVRFLHGDRRLWAVADHELIGDDSEPNHAGHGETSLQLALDARLVDLATLPKDRVADGRDGVGGGDPREATAEDGQRMIRRFLAEFRARMAEAAD